MYKIILIIASLICMTGCNPTTNIKSEPDKVISNHTSEAVRNSSKFSNDKEVEKVTNTQIDIENDKPAVSLWSLSEHERQELIMQYGKMNKIRYRNKEERFENPYFFPLNQEQQDVFVQFPNVSLEANEYQKEKTCFIKDYLFSFKSGDVYALWYPIIQYREASKTDEGVNLIGYFYVNGEIIIRISNLYIDNKPINIFEFDEEKLFNLDYCYPVCYTNFSIEAIKRITFFDDGTPKFEWLKEYNVARFITFENDWEIDIYEDSEYMVTDMRTISADNNRYARYVWGKGMGLVGYQYGQGIGGGQHDFFADDEVLIEYLDRN